MSYSDPSVAHTRGIQKVQPTKITAQLLNDSKIQCWPPFILPPFEEVWSSMLGSNFLNYSNDGIKRTLGGLDFKMIWKLDSYFLLAVILKLFNLKWLLKKLESTFLTAGIFYHHYHLDDASGAIKMLKHCGVTHELTHIVDTYGGMMLEIVKDGNFLQTLTALINVIFEWL